MTTILLIIGAVIGYVAFVLASPATACRSCRGWGAKGERWRRRQTCRHCGGTGTRFRPGAPLIHRALSTASRARAKGNLTTPPWRPPRRGTPTHPSEGDNRP